jgi:NAD(P)-dependent dehydrogenase (short-subunit alcohol dehydrogenase family)
MDWLGLSGVTVAVTGAAGGVGRALVESFVDAGASVAALDLDQAAVDEAVEPHRSKGASVTAVAVDVADEGSVKAAAEQVKDALGPVGVLINNAGILHSWAVKDIDVAEWNRLLSVNLTGYLLCARTFAEQMREVGSGALVHVASIGGHLPQAYGGAYSVSKAGVRMLSQVLAVELGEFGIRSNVVSPAMLITPLSEGFYRDPEVRARREALAPSGRIGSPQDIADTAVFLASARSTYVNGGELLVDGALSINLLAQIPRPGFDRAAAEH